jgi:hypothetical protein
MGRTCSITSVEVVKEGRESEERCERIESAARDAMAGAPRICALELGCTQWIRMWTYLHALDGVECLLGRRHLFPLDIVTYG